MKFKSWLLLTLMALLAVACKKNEVDVIFDLDNKVNGNYRLVYYASDPRQGWFAEVVTPVQNGKFEAKCLTRNPTVVFIFYDTNEPAAAFYAERGDKIVITGDSPNPASWKISGNKLTEKLSLWLEKNRDVLTSRDPARINKAVETYVNDNLKDPLSVLLLCVYFDRSTDSRKFTTIWNKLDQKALDPMIVDLVNCADIISGSLPETDIPSGVTLSTAYNGADSVKIKNTKGNIFYFWNTGAENRKETIEILKTLSMEFPDSASRNIVDVCMESDSLAWSFPLRSDSLSKTVRAWAPKGVNDETLMKLGINRVPSLIVIDSNGKKIYKGSDGEKAASEFRKLMKK